MRIGFEPAVEAFRDELRTWLVENRPSLEEMASDPPLSSGHAPKWARSWMRRMFEAGWLVPGWPPERGGRNAGPIEQLVYLEEMARAGLPRTTNPQGLEVAAPSIFEHGTDEQVRSYAMPVLRGEKTACLGMSEPGAGSDLASLSTSATLEGNTFVINGQKLWTSGARYADFCLLFCRTEPGVSKHQGISAILIDMNTPGIVVRPVPNMLGPEQADLNEVFFTEVVVPSTNLVGRLNEGWQMANASLAHERGMVWMVSLVELETSMKRLLEAASQSLAHLSDTEKATAADAIAESYMDIEALRCLGYRSFGRVVQGKSAPEQSLLKLFSSETRRNFALIATELEGPQALTSDPRSSRASSILFNQGGTYLEQYFRSFALTISAGSSEIQRNIVAEKVLGLPRS